MTVGDRIMKEREKRLISRSNLAANLGISTEALRAWETSKAEPKTENLKRLCDLWGISLKYLETGESETLKELLHRTKAEISLLTGWDSDGFSVEVKFPC